MRYYCMRPEWVDDEPCPIGTEEIENCAECAWALECDE